ncbi:MAG: MFS transporter [Thermoleophilia bacterium]|nr:MFS transporter [Thermoleophilia bacterium]
MTDDRGATRSVGGAPGGPLVTTRKGGDLLAASLMFMLVMSAVTMSLMPVVTDQLRTMGLTDARIGLLTSIFMGFYGASGVLSGIGAARWGGRLFVVSSGCFVVGSVIFALSSGFAGFLLGRALQGIGGGIVTATSTAVMAHALPRERLGRALGLWGCGFGVGTMVALFVMPAIQDAGGYRAVFLATAGLGLAAGVAVLAQNAIRALPHHPEGTTTVRGLALSLGQVITNSRVILLGLCNMAGLGLGMGVLAWTPSFLQDVHGAAETTSMYLIAGLGVSQILGNPLGIVAMKHWGKFWTLVVGIAAALVTTVVVGFLPGVALPSAMVIVSGFFGMFFFPVMLAYIPEVVARPDQVGPATGVNTLMGFVGSLVAPWIFGLILDAGGQSEGSYVAGFVMLGAFGVAALLGLGVFRVLVLRAATPDPD